MSAHQGPKAKTRGYAALQRLYDMGGRVTRLAWFTASDTSESLASFDQLVSALLTQQCIQINVNEVLITAHGREWLGHSDVDAPLAPRQLVQPRYVAPIRELRSSFVPRAVSLRPGAFDYRDIPSRHGDQRVGFGADIKAVGDGQA